MGTNYYLEFSPCSGCGKSDLPLHIGKSSGGWCFALRVYPEFITSLEDWKRKWTEEGVRIVNEYGEVLSANDMLKVITERSSFEAPSDFSYERNKAIKGPNNLCRHLLGGHCVGHGEGTWDLILGDFS